jgi:PAS domain S-box-containing protein
MRDITERRSVERRYQALIENASDLIVVLDADGEITYSSPASERILGYDPETLVGTDAFDMIHPEDRDWVRERFRQDLAGELGETTSEYRVQRADGAWIWIESRGTDLFDDPAVEGYVVNAREVTDRKQRERALERQNERLESFASVAAHDLRNPLNIVEGHLALARETGAEHHFEAIDQAASRMETLVDDLLLLAREGKIVDETEAVDLETIAQTAWTNVETERATLEVSIDDRILAADWSRLSSLFENLFRNSVEHGSTGSRTQSDGSVEHDGSDVTVRVGTTPTGFYVEDDGAGIPLDARDEIFDRGFSTEPNGTGLGLPIVQGVATAHGWAVELDDTDGDWTRFEVSGVEWVVADETVQGEPTRTTDT